MGRSPALLPSGWWRVRLSRQMMRTMPPMGSLSGAPVARARRRRGPGRRMALRLGLVTSLALGQTFVGGGSGVGPARAQAAEETRPKLTEAQKQEVRDRYDKATRFYYLRKYPEAIVEYEGIY